MEEAESPEESTYDGKVHMHAEHFEEMGLPKEEDIPKVLEERGPRLKGVVAPRLSQEAALVKVDCTREDSKKTCFENHVQAYPSIVLFRKGTSDNYREHHQGYTHVHYYGDRTPDSLLTFITRYEQIAAQREGKNRLEGSGSDAPKMTGTKPSGKWTGVDADAPLGAKLAAAMHKAGLVAPGDSLRSEEEIRKEEAGEDDVVRDDADTSDGGKAMGNNQKDDVEDPQLGPTGAAAEARGIDGKKGTANAKPVGCNLSGFIDVPKVPGTLSISVDTKGGHTIATEALNLTHVIHDLSFGSLLSDAQKRNLPEDVLRGIHAMKNTIFVSEAPVRMPNTRRIGTNNL